MMIGEAPSGAMTGAALKASRSTMARASKSFSLASKLLPRRPRNDAAVVYAFCRRADDAVDLAPAEQAPRALAALAEELRAVYAGDRLEDELLAAFRDVVRRRRIPRRYPQALLEGLEMDARGARYDEIADLCAYGYRVAGAVGLMMCHVMGVRDEGALVRAAHLGIAMQITNVCRDVAEDWRGGRLYLPADRLAARGAPDLAGDLGGPFPKRARTPVAAVIRELLIEADRYYSSGDRGMGALAWRCQLAVRAARRIYAEIGSELAKRGFDPLAGRAVVPRSRKLVLAGQAVLEARPRGAGAPRIPRRELAMVDALADPETLAGAENEGIEADRASSG